MVSHYLYLNIKGTANFTHNKWKRQKTDKREPNIFFGLPLHLSIN